MTIKRNVISGARPWSWDGSMSWSESGVWSKSWSGSRTWSGSWSWAWSWSWIAELALLFPRGTSPFPDKGEDKGERVAMSSKLIGHVLPSDCNRSLQTECEAALAWIDRLAPNMRLLAEDADFRVTFDEQGRATRVVRKRNPEYLWDDPVPEEQEEGLRADPGSEDVYDMAERGDLELVPLSEGPTYTPKDKWDLVFDATEFIRWYQYANFRGLSPSEREELIEKKSDELIYSSDWFPSKVYRKYSARVSALAKRICNGSMTRYGLWRALEDKPRPLTNGDLASAKSIALKPLPQRAAKVLESEESLLLAAKQELVKSKDPTERAILKDEIKTASARVEAGKRWFKNLKPRKQEGAFAPEERAYLWDLYLQVHREEPLPKHKFIKRTRARLVRQGLPAPEISSKITELVAKYYPAR